MVSPELLRRYKFFAGLSNDQIISLAQLAEEITAEPGSYLFYEGGGLTSLYLVLEGRVAISLSLPEVGSRAIIPPPTAKKREVTVSMVGVGEIFAWSSLVPPYQATSNARALTRCRVVALSAAELRQRFDRDTQFGYQMLLRVAQIARDRLQDLHYESLANVVGDPL
ncbi:MAG: cyclic nucleotide-binding domain-containing protein [Chloroflexales bacterium]|nr:cyclic nucleotide-binding domain-containing protein [Chloroflexales bacterium]